ncbi:MAG: hypothetical protein MK078_13450 [Crocinitomicaceae bacterium]|nr:hypothetical protein [Crocinitomicaceae bacterium]
MSIEFNGSSDELSSEYYEHNKSICEAFEKFCCQKGGSPKGTYNAWSYNAVAEINDWRIKINKATYSSGNLLIPSNTQSLLVNSVWINQNYLKSDDSFKIYSKWKVGFMKRLLGGFSELSGYKGYWIKGDSALSNEFVTRFSSEFASGDVHSIEYNGKGIRIEFHSEDLHLESLDQIIIGK